MNNNKQKLYEQIMSNVSRIVRRKLDEAVIDMHARPYYQSAVKSMAEYIMDYYGFNEPDAYIYDATDLMETEEYDLLLFINEVETNIIDIPTDYYKISDEIAHPKTYIDDIDRTIKDDLEDVLSDEELEAYYDDIDVCSVANKRDLGGGGYEAQYDFCKEVKSKLIEMITLNYNNFNNA